MINLWFMIWSLIIIVVVVVAVVCLMTLSVYIQCMSTSRYLTIRLNYYFLHGHDVRF